MRADSDPLAAVVAHPPSPQLPLRQELPQVAPERLLGTQNSGGDFRGGFSRPMSRLPLTIQPGADPFVLLAGDEHVGALRVGVDHLDRRSHLLLNRLPLRFGEFERHRRTLVKLITVQSTSAVSKNPGDSLGSNSTVRWVLISRNAGLMKRDIADVTLLRGSEKLRRIEDRALRVGSDAMSNRAQVESICFAALEKKSAAERADYLDRAWGADAVLRQGV